jgi:sortase A
MAMTQITEQEVFTKCSQRFMRWTRGILLLTGFLALSYVALTLLDARKFQKDATLTLEKQIQAEEQHRGPTPRVAINEGDVLGRLEIPRIGLSVAVLQGTTSKTLRHGVGHIEKTALPGESGNVGIAGHRDTYFRKLKDARPSDEIRIQTSTGLSRYEVDWIQIVAPGDTDVLTSPSGPGVTLITCYPFYFIGAAPERFIVHAHKL